jgi:hypothetical protein
LLLWLQFLLYSGIASVHLCALYTSITPSVLTHVHWQLYFDSVTMHCCASCIMHTCLDV